MKSFTIMQHYAILSVLAMRKQAVFTKTQAANIIYTLRKNFKQISRIDWNVFNFFADRNILPFLFSKPHGHMQQAFLDQTEQISQCQFYPYVPYRTFGLS